MKGKRLLSFILVALMLVMTFAPTVSYGASKTVTIKINSKGEPSDDDGDGWYIDYDDYKEDDYGEEGIILEEGYTFKFSGSTCDMPVYNYGTISSGTFSEYVINMEDATISGGTFNGTVENNGTIKGGTFSGSKILNYESGTISGGTFKKLLKSEGKITGGEFKSATLFEGGSVTGGTFTGPVTNYGDLPAKKNTAKFTGGFINLGFVAGGSFDGSFVNGDSSDDDYEESEVKGGTFTGDKSDEFNNYAIISGGTFDIPVNNYNTIDGGDFNETVYLEDSKYYVVSVTGGSFSDIENNTKKYKLDEDGLEFRIKTVIKGTGNVSVQESAESGDTVRVLTAPGNKVELDSIRVYDSDDDKVTIKKQSDNYYTFTMPSSSVRIEVEYDDYDPDSEMDTIKLYIDEPADGETLGDARNSSSSNSKNAGYTVSKTVWYYDDEKYTGKAEEGEEYTVEITVTADSGTTFVEDPYVTLNGYKCKVTSATTSKIVVEYVFDEVENVAHVHKYTGKYNSTYHWQECSCGATKDKEAHTYGSDGYCTVCGHYDSTKVASKAPFTDVKTTDYYYDAVNWAYTAKPQVTDGTTKTTFSPKDTCTRGQVVTFLWRAMGQPEPKTTRNPFTDVKTSDYYYKPVLWAYENKVTDGTSATKFSPDAKCTNSQIITFIWRAMGEPNKDANAEKWYTDAYYWAKYNDLLKGSYTGTYNLDANCPRCNVIYYLYNYNNIKSGSTAQKDTSAAAKVTTSLKNLLEGYDVLADEYASFIKNFDIEDYTSKQLSNFENYQERLAQKAADVAALSVKDMNSADLAYFFEMMNKINTKLAKANNTL